MFVTTTRDFGKSERAVSKSRVTSQPVLPQYLNGNQQQAGYDIYPYHSLGGGKICSGYSALAEWMSGFSQVIVDGFSGVIWSEVQQGLKEAFESLGYKVKWVDVSRCLKSTEEIDEIVAPFLGEPDSVWGKKCSLRLESFFRMDELAVLQPDEACDLTIAFGTGAGLLQWTAPVVYLEVPKNEIQYRMRAGSVTNLGSEMAIKPSAMYKRCYFVDWVVLNQHKKALLARMTVLGDVQWSGSVSWMLCDSLKEGMQQLSRSVLRVRPWFEPGAWGGQWMKERFKGISQEEVNFAWSFELIVPENGLVFESDGHLQEVPFEFLMFEAKEQVLGKHAAVFGEEFPIRFDFLDTWDGGNLSIQCHPSMDYIRSEFGENFTQDETYYILDCKDNAKVYLGFQEDIDPEKFRKALEESQQFKQEIDIKEYVQEFVAEKHGLYLIPNGTVHSAGKDNLVLEISATPYIFTFKMYDWLRLDLNGEPRPINIDHAFKNLRFERKGERVVQELISKPAVIEESTGWQLIHLPTHPDHFYDVHRIEFDSTVTLPTNDSCQVMMLVEGTSVCVEIADDTVATFQYAETFVIPAAAREFTLINQGEGRAKVVKAFVKESIDHLKA